MFEKKIHLHFFFFFFSISHSYGTLRKCPNAPFRLFQDILQSDIPNLSVSKTSVISFEYGHALNFDSTIWLSGVLGKKWGTQHFYSFSHNLFSQFKSRLVCKCMNSPTNLMFEKKNTSTFLFFLLVIHVIVI